MNQGGMQSNVGPSGMPFASGNIPSMMQVITITICWQTIGPFEEVDFYSPLYIYTKLQGNSMPQQQSNQANQQTQQGQSNIQQLSQAQRQQQLVNQMMHQQQVSIKFSTKNSNWNIQQFDSLSAETIMSM